MFHFSSLNCCFAVILLQLYHVQNCVNCWKKVPFVTESKAEINPIFRRSMIIHAFWSLIGFCYFKAFPINWARSYCRDIVTNRLHIDFKMSWCICLSPIPKL